MTIGRDIYIALPDVPRYKLLNEIYIHVTYIGFVLKQFILNVNYS